MRTFFGIQSLFSNSSSTFKIFFLLRKKHFKYDIFKTINANLMIYKVKLLLFLRKNREISSE